MVINIKVIAGSKGNLLKEESGLTKVYLTARAVDGKANKALIRFLADHYHVKPGQVIIIKGLKSCHKTIKIEQFNS